MLPTVILSQHKTTDAIDSKNKVPTGTNLRLQPQTQISKTQASK